jgi:hypothetical protein
MMIKVTRQLEVQPQPNTALRDGLLLCSIALAPIRPRSMQVWQSTVVSIIWHPLRYHKRPPALATLWDIACGITMDLWLVLRHRLDIVHAREGSVATNSFNTWLVVCPW